MFRNYLTIAIRNLRRYRSFTLLNIAGLALGITCGLLIFLLVRHHLSMDGYHQKVDRTYRVVSDIQFGSRLQTPGVPYPFGRAFRMDFPEVESVASVRMEHNRLVTVGIASDTMSRQKFMMKSELGYVEPEFFETFDYEWIKGSQKVLTDPYKAVITSTLAEKLFGDKNPIGQTFSVDNEHKYTVAGLVGPLRSNTAIRLELFLSYASYRAINTKEYMEHWGGVSGNHHCYVVLPEGMQAAQIDQALPAFLKKHQEEYEKWEHHLQPLKEVYFDTEYNGEVPKVLVWALAIVGLFLIGTACINFINLATAQALNRSREVGVRKVLGSNRGQLFAQFLLETGIITLLALTVSVCLAYWALPYVNDLTHSELSLHLFSDVSLWPFLLATLIGVTFFAGAYPALILAGFKPVQALKGRITTQTLGGYSVRRSLVVAQFIICQVMIIAAIVITAQMNHLKEASLGFNSEAIVMLPIPSTEKTKVESLRQQLLQTPGVQKVSFAFDAPSGDTHNQTNCRFDTRQEDEQWYINTRPGDDQFLSTFGLTLSAGRNLHPSDSIREFIINETAVEKLGFATPEEVIGKNFKVWGYTAPIVGVVKDFHTRSLHENIEPVVIMAGLENYAACGVKIDLSNTTQVLAALDQIWNSIYPNDFYSYTFLDEQIARFYEMENALLGLIQAFCSIAVFIGCLGLYGLISFMAARKQKEIGVRKVLGASVAQILSLFGKEFVRLILIAFVLAAPLGWWAMTSWLQNYPYRISMGLGVFLGTVGITLAIALITVSAQSLKAATANPAKSLRSE